MDGVVGLGFLVGGTTSAQRGGRISLSWRAVSATSSSATSVAFN